MFLSSVKFLVDIYKKFFKKKFVTLQAGCRRQFALWQGHKIGQAVFLGPGTDLSGKITIGNQTTLMGITVVQGRVQIGQNVIIATHCSIRSVNHNYDLCNALPYGTDYIVKEVVIEDNVWIGSNVLIVPGVHVGEGAIIGMGAVVTKDVPACAVVAGNPAKIIKYRDRERYDRLLAENKYLNRVRRVAPHQRRDVKRNRALFDTHISERGFVLSGDIVSSDPGWESAILYELAMTTDAILFGNAWKYHIAILPSILTNLAQCTADIAQIISAMCEPEVVKVDTQVLYSDLELLKTCRSQPNYYIRRSNLFR